ncbi:MAG: hypothetical protein EBT63_06785 [Proteobacteria bacterium]|nr:hypothetical protein [Pseudomonadota bacterium]NCA28258.1 hypothetical protein [Pseudomonadota bacterium]
MYPLITSSIVNFFFSFKDRRGSDEDPRAEGSEGVSDEDRADVVGEGGEGVRAENRPTIAECAEGVRAENRADAVGEGGRDAGIDG